MPTLLGIFGRLPVSNEKQKVIVRISGAKVPSVQVTISVNLVAISVKMKGKKPKAREKPLAHHLRGQVPKPLPEERTGSSIFRRSTLLILLLGQIRPSHALRRDAR
jgi:hypothetical protein